MQNQKQLRNDNPQSRDTFSRKERVVVKAFRPEGVGSLLRWEDNAGHGPLLAPEGWKRMGHIKLAGFLFYSTWPSLFHENISRGRDRSSTS
ncbi:hypothetical protein DSLASN_10450 [Desulfoluna limicola]|uniref:Uncharacterized protein n=1 Tax=Desulfoluna limicola TaxID=2810562 RepID=A0ABM7PEA7_9BACT|nr:hypothetical protein DSLASN_10450 [Desulfoluna limicola]